MASSKNKTTGKATTKGKTDPKGSKNGTTKDPPAPPPAPAQMDETPDVRAVKDSTGDTIIGEPNSSSGALEYDSDGNNLYGEDDASASAETTVAANGSPHKRQKSTPKRVAPIFEKNKTIPVCKTKKPYVVGIPVKKTKKAMDECHRAIKDFLKHINEYDSTAILYEMYSANPITFGIKDWNNFPGKPSLVKQYLANCNPYAGEGQIWATFQLDEKLMGQG